VAKPAESQIEMAHENLASTCLDRLAEFVSGLDVRIG
jgi:hypothetical protein